MNMSTGDQITLDFVGTGCEADTVFIVDDDAALREALTFILETEGFQVEAYASARAFLDTCRAARKGCLILDIGLPGMDGLALQQTLHAHALQLPVIFLTGQGDVPKAVQAFKEGAVDFLEKPVSHETILARVRTALADAKRDAARERIGAELADRYGSLTVRQREIMVLVTSGLSNKEVARKLEISTRTVEGHRFRIMEKMHANSLWELTEMAQTCQALDRPGPGKRT
jgi:two-component system response regulator FixJ